MVSDKNLGKTMLLPLAEKMVEKFVNESKIDAEAGTDKTGIFLAKLSLNQFYRCFIVLHKRRTY